VSGRPRITPALVVLAIGLPFGGWRIATALYGTASGYPRATLLAITLFGLYAVPFLLFIGAIDFLEREPKPLLATAFAWGVAVIVAAVPANAALDGLLGKATSPAFAAEWGPALVAPVVEEPLKLLGVVMIVLVAPTQINSVVDGFVYGAVVGLGFQVIEDIGYAVSAVTAAGQGDRIDPVLGTFVLRGFVAGLWSHTLFTALAGAGVAYAVVRHGQRPAGTRYAVVALGLLGAMLCHLVWNSPLVTDGLPALAEVLTKGAVALGLILWLVRAAGAAEGGYYAGLLAALADGRIAGPAEVLALRTARGRAAARRAARARAGRSGERAVGRLQRAQARLAVEISRHGADGYPDSCALREAYRQVVVARHHLIAAGMGLGHRPPWLSRVPLSPRGR
jgi:RsiW-degrading membrane proteinase PrsW (M82 family)